MWQRCYIASKPLHRTNKNHYFYESTQNISDCEFFWFSIGRIKLENTQSTGWKSPPHVNSPEHALSHLGPTTTEGPVNASNNQPNNDNQIVKICFLFCVSCFILKSVFLTFGVSEIKNLFYGLGLHTSALLASSSSSMLIGRFTYTLHKLDFKLKYHFMEEDWGHFQFNKEFSV